MSLISLGNNMYKIRLKCIRDVKGAIMPPSVSLTIYRNIDNAIVQSVALPKVQQYNIVYDRKEYQAPGADLRLEMHVYESASINLSALNSTNGYYLYGENCCNNPGITNVVNSSATGIQFTMDFPRLNTISPYVNNSSPEFTKDPLTYFCVGKPYTFNMNAVDPNGDSLVFSSVIPLDHGTIKPFYTIQYASGYNIAYNVLDGSPDLSINGSTGTINFTPTKAGRYLLAFKCEEYRNNVKIGEIRREFMIETVVCNEVPPIINDEKDREDVAVDTIMIGENYNLTFTGRDSPSDSLLMWIKTDTRPGEDLLDTMLFDATWGRQGIPLRGQEAKDLIIVSQAQVVGEFIWKPQCKDARDEAYNFSIILSDQTFPTPFYDTIRVKLFVSKKDNVKPYFISPDTLQNYDVKNYFIKEGDRFQLAGDSMLKTYDRDSSQIVFIAYESDSTNGTASSEFVFNSMPREIHSTASFVWNSTCNYARSEPYKVKFFAIDNDCLKSDTAILEVNIYVLDGIISYQIQGNTQITDTSLVYTYTTLNQTGVSYNWYGQNVKIISGQGTNSVNVKLNKVDAELSCEVTDIVATCKDTSSLIIGNFVGVDDDKISAIKIYPNPSADIIHIEGIQFNENNKLTLYDIHGKLILEKYITDNTTIDISSLESGIYFIKLNDTYSKVIKL